MKQDIKLSDISITFFIHVFLTIIIDIFLFYILFIKKKKSKKS